MTGDPSRGCHTCGGSGLAYVLATGQAAHIDVSDAPLCTTTCPDCRPSREQAAANAERARRYAAEFADRVARGEASPDDEPPF